MRARAARMGQAGSMTADGRLQFHQVRPLAAVLARARGAVCSVRVCCVRCVCVCGACRHLEAEADLGEVLALLRSRLRVTPTEPSESLQLNYPSHWNRTIRVIPAESSE